MHRPSGIPSLTALVFLTAFLPVLSACAKPAPEPKVGAAGYAGSKKCAECHDRIYNSWQGTLHAMAFQDARKDPQLIRGDFATPNELRNFKKEDVVFVHGVQWKQRYIDKNWRIQQAQWNFESKQWGKSPTFGKVEKSDWRKECAQCHVVGFNPETLTWAEDGVGCESCHGPGGRHAAADGAKRAGTIINPAKLPFGIAAAVCGQCHTRGKSPDGKWSHPIGFKPGDDLGPQHFTIAPKSDEKAWWPSGNMRQHRQQYPEWLESRHMKGGVACFTCHAVHDSPTKFATRLSPNNLCLNCHGNVSTDPVTGHAPIAGAPQHSNCIGCHMAAVGKSADTGDERIHTFKVLKPEATIKLGGGDLAKQPNACNACHYHKDSKPGDLHRALDEGKKQRARGKG